MNPCPCVMGSVAFYFYHPHALKRRGDAAGSRVIGAVSHICALLLAWDEHSTQGNSRTNPRASQQALPASFRRSLPLHFLPTSACLGRPSPYQASLNFLRRMHAQQRACNHGALHAGSLTTGRELLSLRGKRGARSKPAPELFRCAMFSGSVRHACMHACMHHSRHAITHLHP